jgi:hypothetical protein
LREVGHLLAKDAKIKTLTRSHVISPMRKAQMAVSPSIPKSSKITPPVDKTVDKEIAHISEVRPCKETDEFDPISDVLPIGGLWYLDAAAAVSYPKFYSQ